MLLFAFLFIHVFSIPLIVLFFLNLILVNYYLLWFSKVLHCWCMTYSTKNYERYLKKVFTTIMPTRRGNWIVDISLISNFLWQDMLWDFFLEIFLFDTPGLFPYFFCQIFDCVYQLDTRLWSQMAWFWILASFICSFILKNYLIEFFISHQ